MNDEYNLSTKTKANVQKSMPKTSTSKACKTLPHTKAPRQRASPDACLYLTKNKQNEVINKNSEDLNKMKGMFWARIRKRAPSWGD